MSKARRPEKFTKVYWLSRDELTEDQVSILKSIHGESVNIQHDNVEFRNSNDFISQIEARSDGYCYAVIPTSIALLSIVHLCSGMRYGMFVHKPVANRGSAPGVKAVLDIGRDGDIWVTWLEGFGRVTVESWDEKQSFRDYI